jgi:hypothetical protein
MALYVASFLIMAATSLGLLAIVHWRGAPLRRGCGQDVTIMTSQCGNGACELCGHQESNHGNTQSR